MKLLCVVSLLFAANAHAFVADAASTPVRHDQDHRSLFFSSLFRLRRQPCVGTEPALRENLAKGGSVTLCRGSTIVLQSAIVVNDLSFDVRCEAPPRLSLFRRRRQQSKCVISGNDATNLFTGSPSVISFQDVEFQNGGKDPSVLCCGGAFFIDAGRVTFEQCTFSDNKAPFGGALFIQGVRTIASIKNCVFRGNEASQVGGAIVLTEFSQLAIQGTSMISNQAEEGGSSIASLSKSSLLVEGSVIANGVTQRLGGGAMHVLDSKVSLKNTTFAGNLHNGIGTFRDIAVNDDDPAAFVDCDISAKVNFCNGKGGIFDSGAVSNTNCVANGILDANDSACRI